MKSGENESTAEEFVHEKEKDDLKLSPMKDKKDEDIKLESPDSAEFNQQNHEEVSSLDTDEHTSQSEANKSLLAESPEEEKDDLVLALRKDENNEDTKLE